MDILRIRLTEEGGVRQFTPDFKVMRGSYGNILINIEVPKSLLIEPVEEGGEYVTGNSVRIGAIIRTATGHNLQTQRYEFARISDFAENEVEYYVYQRKMPKTFTAWETVNQFEATGSGILEMLINVINWSVDGEARVEEISASPTFSVAVYPSTYLENGEEIDDPSDFTLLQSQVQEIAECINSGQGEIQSIDGTGLTEEGLNTAVADLEDGYYTVNTARFGNEFVLKSQSLISRLTPTGQSYIYGDGSWILVLATTSSDGLMSSADKTKLDGIETGAEANTVTSVNTYTGAVTLTKSDVGLGSVDNTSDADKQISTATQTALDEKVDKVDGKELSENDFTTTYKTKLDNIEEGAEVNTVTSVAGREGAVTLDANDITGLLDENDKIATSYLPDVILGQLGYGGTINHLSRVHMSTIGAEKIGGQGSNILNISTSPNGIGYKDAEGLYFIASENCDFFVGTGSEINLLTGDWLLSTGSGWVKIDNTDAVTMVNGQIGNIETYKGTWNNASTYKKGDTVLSDGVLYLVIADTEAGTAVSNASYFMAYGITATATTSANGLMSSVDKTKLDSIAIDQTYDATSENAQSGIAISETLEGYSTISHTHSEYVTTGTTQTISGTKTFTGESKFTSSHCPTWIDIAGGVGKSSCFTRGAFMQMISGQILLPNANLSDATKGYDTEANKLKFQTMTASGGQPNVTTIATLSANGLELASDVPAEANDNRVATTKWVNDIIASAITTALNTGV